MKYYRVTLLDPGLNKLYVVKAIKDTRYTLGLKECITLVDNTPSRIVATTHRTKARKCAKALREAGATITSTIHII